ncbi:O-methyltransferase [Pseudonocardia hispaniensis]|uniref:O-methyltransferase n=1 Tax=Pseudonocardia hispaniensis TaxID=904933 RepID=A0ABW1J0Z2_9PSEU
MSDAQRRWSAVDDYIHELLVGPDPALDAALEANSRAGLPAIDVSPAQGKLLHLLVRAIGAHSVLEIGTLGGYSTIWLARALPTDGRLVTLERSPVHATVARENIERAGLGELVEIREGPALETLPQLSGPFDFVFVDADKPSNPEYLQWALRLSRPGSVIVVDNVIRGGRVLEADSDDAAVQGTRRFTEMLAAEPRVSATQIQTVGSKGHDGFALAVVLDG